MITCGVCAQPSTTAPNVQPVMGAVSVSGPPLMPVATDSCACKSATGHDWYDWLLLIIAVLVLVRMTDR